MVQLTDKHCEKYSDNAFWEKIRRTSRRAGLNLAYSSLLLYYLLQDKDTPSRAKLIITSALGYFIIPFDMVPDLLPGGLADDLSAIIVALSHVSDAINCSHKEQARLKLKEWFGKLNREELSYIDCKI